MDRHVCPGFGKQEGICMVLLPDDRELCAFCTRTQERLIGSSGITCPRCGGDITEPDHFASARHLDRVHDADRYTMAQVIRGS